MTDAPRRAIAWFRRDLRLADNRMLESATRDAERVWPVFVADPGLLSEHAGARGRVAWFAANLAALDDRLREHGSALTVLDGEPWEVLPRFAGSVGAHAVYAGADECLPAVARDRRVADAIGLTLVDDLRIVPPGELLTRSEEAYTVYTPFRRTLDAIVDEAPDRFTAAATPDLGRLAPRAADAAGTSAFPMPDLPYELPEAGEVAATDRLRAFLRSDLAGYRDERDRPDLDTTSRMSPYLRVGAISGRATWRAALNAAVRGRERADRRLVQAARPGGDDLARRAGVARVLRARPGRAPTAGDRELPSRVRRHRLGGRPPGGRADVGVARGQDRLSLRRRRHAAAGRYRLDAQPGATGDRQLLRQGPRRGLAARRGSLPRAPPRRRYPAEHRELAMGGGRGHRRRAVLPRLQPDPAGQEVRPAGELHSPLGARA